MYSGHTDKVWTRSDGTVLVSAQVIFGNLSYFSKVCHVSMVQIPLSGVHKCATCPMSSTPDLLGITTLLVFHVSLLLDINAR